MKRFLKRFLDDVFYWLGAVLISIGAGLVYLPVGLCVLGGFCLGYSFLLGRMMAQQGSAGGEQ